MHLAWASGAAALSGEGVTLGASGMTERLHHRGRESTRRSQRGQESDEVGPERAWLGLWILALGEWSGWYFPKTP